MIDPEDAEALRTSFALIDVSARVQNASERYLRADGRLTYVQFRILTRLAHTDRPSLRMHELADGVVLSRSGLTYQVSTLERRGLCVRSAAADDDRGVVASITAEGRVLVERLVAGYAEAVQGALPAGSRADRGLLLAVLTR